MKTQDSGHRTRGSLLTHYWRIEPAVGIDPKLARERPSFAFQYVLCLRSTDEPVAMTRRIPRERWKKDFWGPVRTAWIGCGQIETKRHESLQAGKKFLERKFTRTQDTGR